MGQLSRRRNRWLESGWGLCRLRLAQLLVGGQSAHNDVSQESQDDDQVKELAAQEGHHIGSKDADGDGDEEIDDGHAQKLVTQFLGDLGNGVPQTGRRLRSIGGLSAHVTFLLLHSKS